MFKPMVGAFIGKLLAALFLALCGALGFGPGRWAEMLVGIEPTIYGRAVFIGLGALVALFTFWPRRIATEARVDTTSPLSLPPMTVTEIAEYLREQSEWGWRQYAKLNFKRFVQDVVPSEMRRAAQSHEVRFIGTPPNSAEALIIDPTYWQYAFFDERRIWDRRNRFFTSFPSANMSVPGLQNYQFGKAPRIDVMRTWPRATFLQKVYSRAWVGFKHMWFRVRSNF